MSFLIVSFVPSLFTCSTLLNVLLCTNVFYFNCSKPCWKLLCLIEASHANVSVVVWAELGFLKKHKTSLKIESWSSWWIQFARESRRRKRWTIQMVIQRHMVIANNIAAHLCPSLVFNLTPHEVAKQIRVRLIVITDARSRSVFLPLLCSLLTLLWLLLRLELAVA